MIDSSRFHGLFRKLVVAMALCMPFEFCFGSDDAFFEQRIRPVLIEHCYRCHSSQASELSGNLSLEFQAGWKRGGDSGRPSIVPGDAKSSMLIQSMLHETPGLEMPPDRPKLADSVIADFVKWINEGAKDPRLEGKVEQKRADKSWWSLQPRSQHFSHQSIDEFIDTKLQDRGLKRNPIADPRTLIRRMTFDLHGLPPTFAEVTSFVRQWDSAQTVQARQAVIEQLVDRLLESPRYGEQWGRHWLDVVRFGESNGFERNVITDNIFPFRDYVIRSINDDKPFNRFITEHLAGDVLGKDQPEIEIGSAFLVAGPYDDVGNQDPVAAANIRAATLDEMITATGSAFLGMTVHCARCHNHKFDPIPTDDYYRLRAAFEGTTHGTRALATREQRKARDEALAPMQATLKTLSEQLQTLQKDIEARAKKAVESERPTRPKIDPNGTEESFPATQAKFVRFSIQSMTGFVAGNPGSRLSGGRLTEFQVWSAEDPSRNVALGSMGTVARGERAARAEDFPEAYGPQHCIDGAFGEAWFIGNPAVLTLTLPRIELIDKVVFINARGERGLREERVRGNTPCEYEIQVSLDGEVWKTVASHEGREPWSEHHAIEANRTKVTTDHDRTELNELQKKIADCNRQIAAVPALPVAFVGNHKQPTEKTFVQRGGDPTKPLHEVFAASLSLLDQSMSGFELPSGADEGLRRLALAQWLTRDDHPLVPRVLANRIWQYHFGTGIVDSPNDFGYMGGQPSHPELLDFLAERLVKNSWKLKGLHREILMSSTYQQSSSDSELAAGIDKQSRLLWRFPPRRLSAEEIRDTILAISGSMQFEPVGGPGFRLYHYTQNNVSTYLPLDKHGPETFRRAVYHQNARASLVDLLSDFDLPDTAFSTPKRAVTTSPLQALTMLNHSFTLDMAKRLVDHATKMAVDLEQSTTADQNHKEIKDKNSASEKLFVKEVYRLAFQREPTEQELELGSEFAGVQGREALCRAILNSNELLFLD